MSRILNVILVIGLVVFSSVGYANNYPDKTVEAYEGRITRMVGFLEHLFNAIGNDNTKASEKQEIIQNSFLKVFDNSNVQIEDDLDEERDVVINKNVQAYLKDIDFFYRNVTFSFDIQEITINTNSSNQQYFKVRTNRKLNGVSQDGKKVNNVQERFIEINIDPTNEALKIASIYTTKLSNAEMLTKWWQGNSFEWKVTFKRAISEEGDPSVEQLQNIRQLKTLDISYNKYITDFSPLRMLHNLEDLNLNSTKIADLSHIKNLRKLKKLDISNTAITSIDEIAYLHDLELLLIENTDVSTLEPLYKLKNLTKLYCKNTKIRGVDISALERSNQQIDVNYDVEIASTSWWSEVNEPWKEVFGSQVSFAGLVPSSSELAKIENSSTIDVSGNKEINSLVPLQFVKGLKQLNISETNVTDIKELEQLTELEYLDISENWITDITPLYQLEHLKQVNIDDIQASSEDIKRYVMSHPHTKVIYKANENTVWFLKLPEAWKEVLLSQAGYSRDDVLKTEQIFDLFYIKKIDIIGRNDIDNLDPLSRLFQLEELYIANTMKINDLSPLAELEYVKRIDCSFNPIENLEPLEHFRNLKYLNISNTYVSSLGALRHLYSLEELLLTSSRVNDLKDVRNLSSLKKVELSSTDVKSINPLITLMDLEEIICYNTKVLPKEIERFKEIRPAVKIVHY